MSARFVCGAVLGKKSVQCYQEGQEQKTDERRPAAAIEEESVVVAGNQSGLGAGTQRTARSHGRSEITRTEKALARGFLRQSSLW